MSHRLHSLDDGLCRTVRLLPEGSPENQRLFATGLLWCYGFHHEEAYRHFSALVDRAPECALGYWGKAYSLAPFYNRPWDWFNPTQQIQHAKTGFDAIQSGLDLFCNSQHDGSTVSNQPTLTYQLLSNLSLLFRCRGPVENQTYRIWQTEYADAMQTLAQRYNDHPDIITLTAEAMLNCTPWQHWDIRTGKPNPHSHVLSAVNLIETTIECSASNRLHPGLLHLHIHALEMSPEPQRARSSATYLRNIGKSDEPDKNGKVIPPHLPHMATHIDMLTGHYRDAIETNVYAVSLDEKVEIETDEFYLISRLHNMHLQLAAAMMAGRLGEATQARQQIEILVLRTDPDMQDEWLRLSIEGFYANRLHTHIRFGQWGNLTTDKPADPETTFASMPYAKAMTIYARSVAYANSNQPDLAQQGLNALEKLREQVPDWYLINNNPAQRILAVALAMLEGEWRYHAGEINAGLDKLRHAVALCDQLDYCEPWPWMHPPRHALGALLLAQNQVDEATTVYETDLGINDELPRCLQHPANLWSLTGLAECYEAAGNQVRLDELKNELKIASEYADINIKSSCYCRN